ncbi:MAG: GNAT family N-acetyltransferase [Alphaproteobacteria bacterium]|nr:GNAT family N-acetyltransferase [Alphaproteobacteria bacterium]
MTGAPPGGSGPAALLVRRAWPRDAEAVAALAAELNAQQGDPVGRFDAAAIRRDAFGSPAEITIHLAEWDGAAAGYGSWFPAYESGHAARGAYVADLFGRPAFRRRGMGRALLAAIAAEVAAEGRTYLWWAAKPWNDEARAFYAALGASTELVTAHALTFDAFQDLAAEGRQRER